MLVNVRIVIRFQKKVLNVETESGSIELKLKEYAAISIGKKFMWIFTLSY
jgi:hypothetical protein